MPAPVPALDLFAVLPSVRPSAITPTGAPPGKNNTTGATAPERVIAAELQGRGATSDALAMMVSSMVRMVQVGKERDSRWKAS